MADIPGSVPLTGFVAPTDDTDTFATQDEFWNRGGWRSVADITARDAITADRRKLGMVVRVWDADGGGTTKFYTLKTGLTNLDWIEDSLGGGSSTVNYKSRVVPTGAQDGVNATFTLPGGAQFVLDTITVFLNGVAYQPDSITQGAGRTFFTIVTDTLPVSAEGDSFWISYVES